MKKIIYLFIVLGLFGGCIIFLENRGVKQICFKNNNCVQLEVVDDPSAVRQGLMGRESLDKENGMFFIFDQDGYHAIWMKNTLIPLDVIWLDSDLKIIEIKQNFQPCSDDEICQSYIPKQKAKYVLEINAGEVEKNDLKIGDNMNLK